MGSVHKFRRRPKNTGQFRGRKSASQFHAKRRSKLRRWWGYKQLKLAIIGVGAGVLVGLAGVNWMAGGSAENTFACPSPRVLDGDTLDCGAQRVRLGGIDAPELPGHCRSGRQCTPGDPYASTENLRTLASSAALKCRQTDTDVYGRIVARCSAGETDLSCAQIEGGYAVRRYGVIFC